VDDFVHATCGAGKVNRLHVSLCTVCTPNLPLSHGPLTWIKKVSHPGRTRVCCVHTCVLTRIKFGSNPAQNRVSTHL